MGRGQKVKPILMKTAFIVIGTALLIYGTIGIGHAKMTRPAAFAGSFYPADQKRLESIIKNFGRQASMPDLEPSIEGSDLRALIMPHAGYIYSGLTAAHGMMALEGRSYEKVVLLGPDHHLGFTGSAVTGFKFFDTPLGTIPVHPDAQKLLSQPGLFDKYPLDNPKEHSLEVILPFLQVGLASSFSLVPVVVGKCDVEQTANAVEALLDKETLLVVSSDLSHYLNYDAARKKDLQTIDQILALDIKAFSSSKNSACGKNPLLVLMTIAAGKNLKPVLLHYANSGDTAGTKQQVVGYCAMAFFKKDNPEKQKASHKLHTVSAQQGLQLLRLARQTIGRKLKIQQEPVLVTDVYSDLTDPVYNEKFGTFVTIHLDGRLRGCIGSLEPERPLKDDVRANALNAAFKDPRFEPLTEPEFFKIRIEVSILSRPQTLSFSDGRDLVKKLRPGVDGVIIKKGMARATFLPQVWEQLPTPERFLSQLCLKAGLPADEWENKSLTVQTYQVQYFEEPE